MKAALLDLFAIQLDESVDVASCAQWLGFTRSIEDGDFKEEFLFCYAPEATTTGEDAFQG